MGPSAAKNRVEAFPAKVDIDGLRFDPDGHKVATTRTETRDVCKK
jgi:hypothetical protein